MFDTDLFSLQLDGHSFSGSKIASQHTQAAAALANCVKSTLGPFGLNKLMVDAAGDVIISNDGSTILNQMQVDSPIASLIIDLANEQDRLVGDGTTSVTLVAAEFLRAVEKLIEAGVSTSRIITGFKLACKEACRFLMRENSFKITLDDREAIMSVAKTSLSSKILSDNAEFFADLALQAVEGVKSAKSDQYLVHTINTLKVPGQSIAESRVIAALVISNCKCNPTMPDCVTDAKIACLDFGLSKGKAALGVQIVVDDPSKLEAIRQKEIAMGQAIVDLVVASGANVILTSGTIDAAHAISLAKKGILAINHIRSGELKRIATATGATLVKSLNYKLGSSEHVFEPSLLGAAGKIEAQRYAGDQWVHISDTKAHPSMTLLIRGPSFVAIDEADRAFTDCMAALKRTLESRQLVAGGGASEAAVAAHLYEFSYTISSSEQLVVNAFADALKVIPHQLALNSGCDATEIVADLMLHHKKCQAAGNPEAQRFVGLDLTNRKLTCCKAAGVLDPLVSKVKTLTKATEAMVIITKIDNVIRNNPERQQQDDCH